jgi:DNA-binding Xre family transcriptional regulator
MLSLNLTPIFQVRGIDNPFTFLVKAGFTRHAAHAILNSHTRSFRLDHIEKLCTILICEPNDLLRFTENKNQPLPEGHPLKKLRMADDVANIKDVLSNLPLNLVKEIANEAQDKLKK